MLPEVLCRARNPLCWSARRSVGKGNVSAEHATGSEPEPSAASHFVHRGRNCRYRYSRFRHFVGWCQREGCEAQLDACAGARALCRGVARDDEA
jgi:hypothetical protein